MRVVGIGGGHGLAATLRAARRYAHDVAAVVTVADDGGSSGRLTRELGIPPPGDIRNCLVALADDSELAALYQHRFSAGALADHPLGNLVVAALTETIGDFAAAVRRAGRLIGARGDVYPATTDLVTLGAHVDGGVIRGQVAVARASAAIHSVFLTPAEPRAHPAAVDAIHRADQVVLGPGSLFTSLLATLLVPGIRDALHASTAQRVLVCNARTQRGETQGLDAAAHVHALSAHVGTGAVDVVVAQCPALVDGGVEVDRGALSGFGVKVVEADVASTSGAHDPERLAKVLASLV